MLNAPLGVGEEELAAVAFMLKEIFQDDAVEQFLIANPAETNWARFYEMPTLGLVLSILGDFLSNETALQAKEHLNPRHGLLEKLDAAGLEDWDSQRAKFFTRADSVAKLYALKNTIICLSKYNCAMFDLLRKVADKNDTAFFRVLRIDKSAISCAPIAQRIAIAQLNQEEKFFDKLSNTLSGTPRTHELHTRHIRALFAVLNDARQLQSMPPDQLHDLFVRLGILSDANNGGQVDAVKVWKSNFLKDNK